MTSCFPLICTTPPPHLTIFLDRNGSPYRPGDDVAGHIAVTVVGPGATASYESIVIAIEGKATAFSLIVPNADNRVNEEHGILKAEIVIPFQQNDGETSPLPPPSPGTTHTSHHPFKYPLPPHLPSSFKSRDAVVEYTLTAKLIKTPSLLSRDVTTSCELLVDGGGGDICDVGGSDHPLSLRGTSKSYKFCCLSKGEVTYEIHVPRRGIVIGSEVGVSVGVANKGGSDIVSTDVALCQTVVCRPSGRYLQECHWNKNTILVCSTKGPGVPPGGKNDRDLILHIPANIPPTGLGDFCPIIGLLYQLQVSVEFENKEVRILEEVPVVLGRQQKAE